MLHVVAAVVLGVVATGVVESVVVGVAFRFAGVSVLPELLLPLRPVSTSVHLCQCRHVLCDERPKMKMNQAK